MTEDQLKRADDIFRAMHEHLRNAKNAEVYSSEGGCHYTNSYKRYPKETLAVLTQQLRDWHKLRAYELAEEFEKL